MVNCLSSIVLNPTAHTGVNAVNPCDQLKPMQLPVYAKFQIAWIHIEMTLFHSQKFTEQQKT